MRNGTIGPLTGSEFEGIPEGVCLQDMVIKWNETM